MNNIIDASIEPRCVVNLSLTYICDADTSEHQTTSKSNVGSGSSNSVPSNADATGSLSPSGSTSASGGDRRPAVDWKFTELDVDSNGSLDRKELRILRYLVNKLVKPRPCAKTFAVRCDIDNDRKLTRREWISCFDISADNDGAAAGSEYSVTQVRGRCTWG
jgi:hypothetical protein